MRFISQCLSYKLLFIYFRSTLYKAYQGILPDLDALKISEVYGHRAAAPLITTMDIGRDVPLVDSAFGKV